MNPDKKELEGELKIDLDAEIKNFGDRIHRILMILMIPMILSFAIAQMGPEIKFEQDSFFKEIADYIISLNPESFTLWYSKLEFWIFITILLPALCASTYFFLIIEIDNLFKSTESFIGFRIGKSLSISSALLLFICMLLTKTSIDQQPSIKNALDRAFAMHQVRYVDECKENSDESRKQCQRLVELILAAKK